jgi:dipeptidyl aminopeptidase/acylaminoacyl peptidase
MDEIMSGNNFIGYQPTNVNWAPDNETVYFRWRHNNETVAPYYETKVSSKITSKIDNNNLLSKVSDGFVSDANHKNIYFEKGGCLYKWGAKKSKLIFKKSAPFRLVRVLSDNRIILDESNNLFIYEPDNGSYLQLINFIDGEKTVITDNPSYLQSQQEELFEIVRKNKAKNKAIEEFRDEVKAPSIPTVYLNNKSLGWIKITPDLKHVIFRVDEYSKNERTHIENHITENGYTKSTNARSKVGAKNPNHELYIMNLETKKIILINIDSLPNIYDKPKFLNDNSKADKSREVVYTDAWISNENNNCIVEIKAYDNKTRWIVNVDFNTGKLNVNNQQQNDAWIGGPGISSWNMVAGNIGWLKDGNTFFYQDEKSGYSHLYTYNIKTKKSMQLTKGNYEIHEANLSNDGTKFYISANKSHPGNRGFYHLDVRTKKWTSILTSDGSYNVSLSPDEMRLAVRYSFKNKPWELYVGDNKPDTELIQITDSQTDEFKDYKWREPEVITFNTEDNQTVYARIYRPSLDVKNGAAVQFVHGAGYLQNAHNWWSGYYREYMFNNMLCDMGYTVIDIDYHASKGYGRDFRTSIYQHMGGADLEDQLLGRQYLIDKEGIDPNKIGIYGGSYGGFISIMALLTKPNDFKCGAAVRSVTDWAHYNHEYTSNILNTPKLDSAAYKISSPIYFADGLKNKLLILHGMVDDNVQFQDVVRLNQRFIELGKTNFQMALYPIEPHGFKETSSWVDEYTRILTLFNEELLGL